MDVISSAEESSSNESTPVDQTIASDDGDLHNALVKYVLQSYRLLVSELPQTWNNFHSASDENFEKYGHLVSTELCSIFHNKVLPKIFKFTLTQQQQFILKLLESHPYYEKTEDGFVGVNENERFYFNRLLREGIDIRLVEEAEDIQLEPNSSTQTLAVNNLFSLGKFGGNSGISAESSALLSAVLSNSLELSNCTLLEQEDILKRLRNAKHSFEDQGELPCNSLNVTLLLQKMQKMNHLKEAVADILSNKYV